MSLSVKHFNTWAACLFYKERTDYYEYIRLHADDADVFHFSEVHSCTDVHVPEFVSPEDAGHRAGPIHVRQLQRLEKILGTTHHVYFEPQMNGLHDLDATHPTVQYGNVTCVRKDLTHDIKGGMIYRRFNDMNEQKEGGKPAGKSGHSLFVLKDGIWYQSVHAHGHWDQRSKIDTPQRYVQFAGMMSLAHNHRQSDMTGVWADAKLIVGGDFNITSACEVLECIRTSTQFGEGGGVILNHEFQDGDSSMKTRTRWYPKDKKHREASFVIVQRPLLMHDASFTLDAEAPSDHVLITTVIS